MSHRCGELLHHGQLQEGLDLPGTLRDTLLADPLGHAFDLLRGDLQSRQVEQAVAAGGERRVLSAGVDNAAEDLRAVGPQINPQRLGLREKKLPDIGGSSVAARSSEPSPPWW